MHISCMRDIEELSLHACEKQCDSFLYIFSGFTRSTTPRNAIRIAKDYILYTLQWQHPIYTRCHDKESKTFVLNRRQNLWKVFCEGIFLKTTAEFNA